MRRGHHDKSVASHRQGREKAQQHRFLWSRTALAVHASNPKLRGAFIRRREQNCLKSHPSRRSKMRARTTSAIRSLPPPRGRVGRYRQTGQIPSPRAVLCLRTPRDTADADCLFPATGVGCRWQGAGDIVLLQLPHLCIQRLTVPPPHTCTHGLRAHRKQMRGSQIQKVSSTQPARDSAHASPLARDADRRHLKLRLTALDERLLVYMVLKFTQWVCGGYAVVHAAAHAVRAPCTCTCCVHAVCICLRSCASSASSSREAVSRRRCCWRPALVQPSGHCVGAHE